LTIRIHPSNPIILKPEALNKSLVKEVALGRSSGFSSFSSEILSICSFLGFLALLNGPFVDCNLMLFRISASFSPWFYHNKHLFLLIPDHII